MEQIAVISAGEWTQLLIIVGTLLVLLVIGRIAFKLTAMLFKIGCGGILFIALALALLYWVN
ncbi:MAG: hypothetical protein Kow0080_30460 [Candidatus Promineifilaceae bacterium]